MQITELLVSLILINWDVLDGTSYLLKNWVYAYKCHLKHLQIVMAFYNKVSMLSYMYTVPGDYIFYINT